MNDWSNLNLEEQALLFSLQQSRRGISRAAVIRMLLKSKSGFDMEPAGEDISDVASRLIRKLSDMTDAEYLAVSETLADNLRSEETA